MRHRTALIAILAGVLTSGCIRSTTTIELKVDGSGTILQENAVSAQALAMIKSFAASKDSADKAGSPELFSQEQALKTAETMGVKFVSGEPFKAGDLEGYRARYSFDDITKLKMNMQQGTDSLAPATRDKEPFGFSFSRGATSSLLTIQMPEQTPGGAFPGMAGAPGASDGDKAMATQALGMMKMMMQGMFLDVSLNVDGRIIKSNANHVEGSKVTLLQMDFDKLLADEAALKRLETAKDIKSLADIPGLKIANEQKVVIEFGR